MTQGVFLDEPPCDCDEFEHSIEDSDYRDDTMPPTHVLFCKCECCGAEWEQVFVFAGYRKTARELALA